MLQWDICWCSFFGFSNNCSTDLKISRLIQRSSKERSIRTFGTLEASICRKCNLRNVCLIPGKGNTPIAAFDRFSRCRMSRAYDRRINHNSLEYISNPVTVAHLTWRLHACPCAHPKIEYNHRQPVTSHHNASHKSVHLARLSFLQSG